MLSFAIALMTSYLVTKKWIEIARRRGLVGKDMNKEGDIKVAEAGGIGFIMGLAMGLLFMVAVNAFVYDNMSSIVYLLASLSVALMAAFVGFVDDVLGWKKGLSHRAKVISTLPIAVPLMAVKAGVSRMKIPFIGSIDLGIAYPLVVVPVGVVGAANAFNMIAGLNGLEASMSLIINGTLAVIALTHKAWISFAVAMSVLGATLGFWIWNKYPAKVFPGDVFTYTSGALIATIAILGNMEGPALMLFIPYFIELMLYIRGKLNGVEKESWGVPRGGCLEPPYDKCYSVTHVAMKILKKVKGCATEKEVVLLINAFEAVLAIIVLYLYVFRGW
ncbi:glycosyl transferase family 4 [Ignicoccus pacificus DSM 13166]|uniref:Glycosyl transferase family 4 n=1 Tax=Ignicoccus pacificus DSM 13166 TaxID=940294 RepID=A0A977KBJ2_9CREN|nr:glycosyl transferase family 4 [Ignicoccus pacificus DSM 13166]